MIRPKLQRFKNCVEGKTIFILGGGPSVNDKIIKQLSAVSDRVLCINSAYKFIPNSLSILWTDNSWASKNYNDLLKLDNYKFDCRYNAQNHIKNNIDGLCGSIVLNKTGDIGIDPDINNVRGNNSGAHAINLLVNCKVNTIALVGFDMKISNDGKTHFHNDYTYSIRPSIYKDIFIPCINSMAKSLNDCGNNIKIYNCNKFSELKCFSYKRLEELL